MVKVGGNALNNGVCFRTDNYTVQFNMDQDGHYEINLHKNASGRWKIVADIENWLSKIPLVRGIVALFTSSKILGAIILFGVLMDLFALFSDQLDMAIQTLVLNAAYIVSIGLMAVLWVYLFVRVLRKASNTWQFHGAEHKCIYAYENGGLTFENARSAPRISRRCGTEFAVIFLLINIVFSFVLKYPGVRFLLSCGLAYELFDYHNADKLPGVSLLFKLGYFCQQHFFTREPSDQQLLAAVDALKTLVAADSNDD